ncbi:hypothetical protein ABZ372_23480, partial [Streptomyces sp. NPDC005921]
MIRDTGPPGPPPAAPPPCAAPRPPGRRRRRSRPKGCVLSHGNFMFEYALSLGFFGLLLGSICVITLGVL